jgi:NADPH-dependent 2,4-dienoyl-CoA reductase/sulfur reductase-like enzyme
VSAAVTCEAAIVGAGPAGIGAALRLAALGIESVCLIERGRVPGGIPARYGNRGVPTFVDYRRLRIVHGGEYARALLARLARSRVEVLVETQVLGVDAGRRVLTAVSPTRGRFEIAARALVLTTGAREQSAAERGWIAGARSGRMFFTLQLIDLLRRDARSPARSPLVLGSDLIGYAAAAKLAEAGAPDVALADAAVGPRTPLPARLFFRRWTVAHYLAVRGRAEIRGGAAVESVCLDGGEARPHDAVVLSGLLTPNSELLVQAGLAVTPLRRAPIASRAGALSVPGMFAAGNLLGGFHGAEWCYWSGRRVAAQVAKSLKR